MSTNFTNPSSQDAEKGVNLFDAVEIMPSELTAREQQVLRLIAEGEKSKDIATGLGISVRTVEAHRASIMRKLNLHSSGLLIRYAIQQKLVTV